MIHLWNLPESPTSFCIWQRHLKNTKSAASCCRRSCEAFRCLNLLQKHSCSAHHTKLVALHVTLWKRKSYMYECWAHCQQSSLKPIPVLVLRGPAAVIYRSSQRHICSCLTTLVHYLFHPGCRTRLNFSDYLFFENKYLTNFYSSYYFFLYMSNMHSIIYVMSQSDILWKKIIIIQLLGAKILT